MYDVAISYDSSHYDNALEVKSQLEARDFIVWIDTEGVLPGEYHHGIVGRSLLTSNFVFVLDSSRLRGSKYCKWEYDLAVASGKRIAVFPAERGELISPGLFTPLPTCAAKEISEFVEAYNIGNAAAMALSTLLEVWLDSLSPESQLQILANAHIWDEKPHRKLISRISRDPQILDAAETAMANIESLRANKTAASLALDVCLIAKRRDMILKFAAIAASLAICALAVFSTLAMRQANADRDRAALEMAKQQSLQLAQRSAWSESSYTALKLAEDADAASDTSRALAAKRTAEISSAVMQTFVLPQSVYLGAAITADNSRLLVTDKNSLFAVNIKIGELAERVPVSQLISSGQISCSPNGDFAAVVSLAGE
ncbi:MAG: toll/interleukin-1 receptor domain-containing protein [Clostridiales bacterium]|jgi:hypothetical protein|nr:toll/interleukin-1 receptor domain-containing protein [Clostridiales bacterium]